MLSEQREKDPKETRKWGSESSCRENENKCVKKRADLSAAIGKIF